MLLQQIYDLIVGQIITIPIQNTFGVLYTVLSNVFLLVINLLTGGGFEFPSLF